MKALVKARPGAGLELADVPGARAGDQRRTDARGAHRHLRHRPAHLRNGTRGRAKTIPVPMVIGHEFVGEVVDGGLQRDRLSSPAKSSAARDTSCAAVAATVWPVAAICARHQGRRRQSPRGLRRVHRAADDQRVASRSATSTRRRCHLRSVRQCRAHRAVVSRARRRRADHRRGPDRHHGRRRRPPRRRALRRHHRRESLSARTGAQDGRDAGAWTSRETSWPRRSRNSA